ncbi:uncharacterized protein TRIADDRAFT_53612 [Trichoplax adhaerens]|uniref:G-protein coupled receptors family 1 profile domain-containing protein n=1 Tax=Trichoplax adhaerens TaxID=10228 RepID=B3RPP4_TRIAD|nr:hypothetical protein TRIADDRAFT_53612 [Trichoplax adhaerens]EDV28224.1 hypothetical protein TRIADDRAFT_53612 [Trichoplax adhaerens]|eukprot:XP_002110058.1 hypothetical protein TRIADDRAFT_53612 [Trichoplax adhaerens]
MQDDIDVYNVVVGSIVILTNTALLAFILSKRQLRITSNILLGSMLICGILTGSVWILLAVYREIYRIPIICAIIPMFQQSAFCNTSLHFFIIIIERYYAIAHPFSYQQHHVIKIKILIAILVIWIISLSIVIPMIPLKSIDPSNCTFRNTVGSVDKIYLTVVIIALFFLPLLALLCGYSRILCILLSSQHDHLQRNQILQRLLQKKKAIIQAVAFIGVFILLCVPCAAAFIVLINITEKDRENPILTEFITISIRFLLIYPAANPVLFAIFTANIRKELLKYLYDRSKSPTQQSLLSHDTRINRTTVSNYNLFLNKIGLQSSPSKDLSSIITPTSSTAKTPTSSLISPITLNPMFEFHTHVYHDQHTTV